MFEFIKHIYTVIFGRPFFYRLNYAFFYLGLRGMGFLNYEDKNTIDTGEKLFLKRLLVPKRNFILVDVGANIGGYIKEVLNINPNGSVYGFEPHPKTFAKLEKNIQDFRCNKIEVFNIGLSAQKEKLYLYDHGHNDGSAHASIHKGVIEEIHSSHSVRYEVEVGTLDDFVATNNISKIDLLKVDTEGNELNVLIGASRSIRTGLIDVIHFEFNEMNVISKTFFKEFWDLLSGYEFYRILYGGMHQIQSYNALTCEIFAYQNIVAVKKDAAGLFGGRI
jgi:FkbM family methyltransferase